MITLFPEDLTLSCKIEINDAWDALECELYLWQKSGNPATLWWRDDDAQLPCPQLDQLLHLSASTATPLVLATIPHRVDPSLNSKTDVVANIAIVQHGWSHTNHAPADEKKCELGDHRKLDTIRQELVKGADILTDTFGSSYLPVLVPPWNRISATVTSHLKTYGYSGLSTFGNAPTRQSIPGLCQINTHVDLINWRKDRRFIGTVAALALITSHLSQRRNGYIPAHEATGILTHHLVHDDELWQFLELLFQFTADHRAIQWQSGRDVFKIQR